MGLTWWIRQRTRVGKAPHSRWWFLGSLVVTAPLLLLTSLNGHPAGTPPIWLSVAADVVHLGAAVAWIGGLIALLVLLVRFRGQRPAERAAFLRRAVPRFSALALICVALLGATGFYSAWAQVLLPTALTETDYGQILLVKLGLVLLILIPAAVNLLFLGPRLVATRPSDTSSTKGPGRWARGFSRLVAGEIALGVMILVATGILTAMEPARNVVQAARAVQPVEPAITLAHNAGTNLLTLTLDPAQPGSNQVTVRVQDMTGDPVSGGGSVCGPSHRKERPEQSRSRRWPQAKRRKGSTKGLSCCQRLAPGISKRCSPSLAKRSRWLPSTSSYRSAVPKSCSSLPIGR